MLTRRRWLKRTALSLLAAGSGAAIYTHWIEPFWVEFVKRDLPVASLPLHWQGRTLMQISDVHVGHRVSDNYLIGAFQRASEFKPDIVAYTGDWISLRPDGTPPYEQFKRVIEHSPTGKHATLAALGNHDYGMRWSQPKVAEQLADLAAKRGIRVLRNQAAAVDGLEVFGVDELLAGQCNRPALAALAQKVPRVVLCHNPDAADLDVWNAYQGWILAGHTHGGQCRPPFFPPPMLPVMNKRYTAGEFDLCDGRRMYINRGLGHLTRVRFNVRPEITIFRLVAA